MKWLKEFWVALTTYQSPKKKEETKPKTPKKKEETKPKTPKKTKRGKPSKKK